jgi:dTDP-4-dehydrorhamnose 3,5-epimerase
MHCSELPIPGAFVIEHPGHRDERGSFTRAFCQRDLADMGVDFTVRQVNTSVSRRSGTIRGLHVQVPPHHEQKLVRCTSGALVDVIVDLRPESPSYLRSVQVQLVGGDGRAVLVPARCAHGFQSLADDTEALYVVSQFHAPVAERGLRWDDPALGIRWPRPVNNISSKDASWPLLAEQEARLRTELSMHTGALRP